AETNERLRRTGYPHVQMAYDGLQLEVSAETAVTPQAARPAAVTLTAASANQLRTFTSTEDWQQAHSATKRGSVLPIGTFDGIHLGHQAILRAAVDRAHETGATSTALTFDPSPRKVLRPESAPHQLSTRAQRIEWFSEAGLESVLFLPFTLQLSP